MKNISNLINLEINNNDTLIVSCSGGPDSMFLINYILKYKEEKHLNIICAHVNHNVREESEEEEEFVKNFCETNNITFELLTIHNYSDNFHNSARVQRYNFLKELLIKYKSKILLTAHHGDDLIESILMRINRGSNLGGYSGFKLVTNLDNYKVIRPLIFLTKKEILEYNNANNIDYRIDKTNTSLEYTRNRFRHKVLPILKEENENIHSRFLDFSKNIEEANNFILNYVMKTEIIEHNYIVVEKYMMEEAFIQKKCIELLISNYQKENEFYVTDNIVKEIDKILKSPKGRASIDLPNRHQGIKEKKRFYIKKSNNVL